MNNFIITTIILILGDPLDDPFIGHTQTHPAAGGERTEVRCKRPIPGINDWIGGG